MTSLNLLLSAIDNFDCGLRIYGSIRNPQSAIRNHMIDDTAITSLQRSLSEKREEKRKLQTRLAEIEAESEMLRSQLATYNFIIEQTELALRRVLFPDENQIERPASPPWTSTQTDRQKFNYRTNQQAGHQPNYSEAEIEAEVEKIQLTEKAGNVRFTDFRIPQAATIVLREANGPLHVSEIYRRLADGGFEFRGQHQLITLAVSLSRSKRFRKVAPGTFELDPAYRSGEVA
jgi:hypothetical protein